VVKHALGGWKRDLASPELALVDALFPWAKPDSGRGFLGSLEMVHQVQRQGIHSQTKWLAGVFGFRITTMTSRARGNPRK
jgi:hypothetical protein